MQPVESIDLLFQSLKCCVLLPTYNNAQTLKAVIENVLEYTQSVIVVNDGSTDNTSEILAAFPQVKNVSYSKNQGKGWAMRKGFEYALSLGFEYAITMDTDGQHFAKDLPVFIEELKHKKNAIIIGSRNLNQNNVPGKSSFGNKFSNFWFKLETGIDMPDTQSGYRLYPIKALNKISFFTKKYEFEIEVLVRGAWAGIEICHVPIAVYYPPKEERITHFRPFKDFSRISVLNTFLVAATFLCIKPRDLFRTIQKKNFVQILNDYILIPDESAAKKAAAVALGMFMGIAPFWGFQMLLVVLVAAIFKLNKAVALIVSNISIPPMIPFILFMSYKCGRIWFGENAVTINFDKNISLAIIHQHFVQYAVGALTLATGAALLAGLFTFIFVKLVKKNEKPINHTL